MKKQTATGVTYKKFKDHEKEVETYYKEKEGRRKEHLAELKDKVSFNINELPRPIPADYDTFDKLIKMYDPKAKR